MTDKLVHIFCGFDPREACGFHTFVSGVVERASKPVSIVPLSSMGLPEGTNNFTLSRFLVPYLMGFKGHAIFMDASDMVCLGDIAELDALFDESKAVQVVKHADYQSKHPRKYIGTDMECDQSNYSRKNWASAMLVNCQNEAWARFTPEFIAAAKPIDLLQFRHFDDDQIGELPADWNVLVDEGQDSETARILHWTAGIPAFPHYRNAERAQDWFAEHAKLSLGAEDGH